MPKDSEHPANNNTPGHASRQTPLHSTLHLVPRDFPPSSTENAGFRASGPRHRHTMQASLS